MFLIRDDGKAAINEVGEIGKSRHLARILAQSGADSLKFCPFPVEEKRIFKTGI